MTWQWVVIICVAMVCAVAWSIAGLWFQSVAPYVMSDEDRDMINGRHDR
jgi:hypothetical protein